MFIAFLVHLSLLHVYTVGGWIGKCMVSNLSVCSPDVTVGWIGLISGVVWIVLCVYEESSAHVWRLIELLSRCYRL